MIITVSMGEGAVAIDPHVIRAEGCGSCVILTLYDAKMKVGGLAHVMLPASGVRGRGAVTDEAYQYADTAVRRLLDEMSRKGASRKNITAKIAGGAAMFASYSSLSPAIGRHNVEGVKDALEKEGIPLAGRDTGGNHGRSVEFYLSTGSVVVKAFRMADREL